MVFPGEGDFMATGYQRSKKTTLHNFSFPNLTWGTRRRTRFVKDESDGVSDAGDQRSSSSEFDGATPFRFGGGGSVNRNRRLETEPGRSSEDGVGEGIKEYTEKMMSEFRTVAAKMRESIFRKQVLDDEEEEEQNNDEERRKEKLEAQEKEKEVSPPEAPGAAAEGRPWNLRKRRAACKAPIPDSGNCDGNQYNYKGLGIIEEKRVKSANPTVSKFVPALTRKEIEEDCVKMMGHRPPRRPKKRPRSVQKQINLLHPASYFTKITQDIYNVPDAAENGKR